MTKYFMQNKVFVILFGVDSSSNYNKDISFSGDEYIMNVNLTLITPDNALNQNQSKLKAIAELQDNWDGYGAAPLSSVVINNASNILPKLYKQPEIFPTAAGTIQMEYEKDNGDYLEIQFSDAPTCEVYVSNNRHDKCFFIDCIPEKINGLVNNFYASLL